jgi:hypothetical protein
MTDMSAQNALIARLAGGLGPAAAETLVARLGETLDRPDAAAVVLTLLDELEGVSVKAAAAAVQALPGLDRHAGLSHVASWLSLGVALAESSGATALRYFKDSPEILGTMGPPSARADALAIGFEMAGHDANVAWEYLRTAPQILTILPVEEVRPWLEIGLDLTKSDVVVGIEYIRQIPALAPLLPLSEVRTWLSLAVNLITPNSLGKPDYLATLEFLRTSPALLADLEQGTVRSKVLSLGALLAERSAESGAFWLAEAPRVLRALPSGEWRVRVLQYGLLLGDKDAGATLDYLRRSPEVITLIGDDPSALSRFDQWFKTGMEVLTYSAEGGRAYFSTESRRALASVEQAVSGIPFRQVAKRVKLFIEGLCGAEVTVTSLPDSIATATARPTVSADGRTIAFPTLVRRFSTAEANERWYLVAAAHEAGHLEFGTYRLRLEQLADLLHDVCERYGRSKRAMPDTLAGLFQLYPRPQLAQDLWMVMEDARIEFLLQTEYPGLRRELANMAAATITPRDPAQGLTVKELIVDGLLRLSTGESVETAVPHAVKEEVLTLWNMCRSVLRAGATAEDTVRLAHALYVRMEDLLAPRAEVGRAIQPDEELRELEGGLNESGPLADGYRPVTNWMYRGAMHPEFIKRDQKSGGPAGKQRLAADLLAEAGGGSAERSEEEPGAKSGGQEPPDRRILAGGRSLPARIEEFLSLNLVDRPMSEATAEEERAVSYPEWDHRIQDYRPNWCRVVERPAEAGPDECVDAALVTHRSRIKSLRRLFEVLRPPAFRRVAAQADGDDLDIDAVVRRAAELRAGLEGDDRLFIRHEKKERDVAVAFLVDVSGSTSRRLDSGRRVMDVEKESLVLLCESLEAVGDPYGLYAYSGEGRASVEFFTIKEFDDLLGTATAHRLGGLGPRRQNRDGAAIRHASAKLKAREEKTRLLIMLSDGRPLDNDYRDEYALEDTKAALREARLSGIDAFCIAIDREADSYVRRMYGDVRFTVIDRVESLPEKLPRIYRRLTS